MTQRKTLGLSEARGELAQVTPVPARTTPVPVPRDAETAGGCERCATLEVQVRELRDARDQALMDLARERETTNALRLALPPVHLPPGNDYPAGTDPTQVPLRYVIADRANTSLKTVLGPFHKALKAAIEPRKKK